MLIALGTLLNILHFDLGTLYLLPIKCLRGCFGLANINHASLKGVVWIF